MAAGAYSYCRWNSRTAILKEAEIFGARVVDQSTEGFALEATGDPEKLDEFIDGDAELRRYRRHAFRDGVGVAGKKKLRLAPPIPRGAGSENGRAKEEETF